MRPHVAACFSRRASAPLASTATPSLRPTCPELPSVKGIKDSNGIMLRDVIVVFNHLTSYDPLPTFQRPAPRTCFLQYRHLPPCGTALSSQAPCWHSSQRQGCLYRQRARYLFSNPLEVLLLRRCYEQVLITQARAWMPVHDAPSLCGTEQAQHNMYIANDISFVVMALNSSFILSDWYHEFTQTFVPIFRCTIACALPGLMMREREPSNSRFRYLPHLVARELTEWSVLRSMATGYTTDSWMGAVLFECQ